MRLGEYQELIYIKKVDFGVYLGETENAEERVLLPAKQVPADAKRGDKIKVFLYKDSKDRMIATTNEPKLTLGQFGVLTVKEIGKIGAFLDWAKALIDRQEIAFLLNFSCDLNFYQLQS